MRIVGGEWRGRPIDPPKGRDVSRPTTDRVREAMASMIESALDAGIDGAHVLDAFAGSGALGIEMLSRGAEHAVFFDLDRRAAALVRQNLFKLGCDPKRFQVICGDVVLSSKRGRMPGAPFDLILIDPPYALGTQPAEELLVGLIDRDMIGEGAVVLFERTSFTPSLKVPGFTHIREKRYGQTCVDLLRKE